MLSNTAFLILIKMTMHRTAQSQYSVWVSTFLPHTQLLLSPHDSVSQESSETDFSVLLKKLSHTYNPGLSFRNLSAVYCTGTVQKTIRLNIFWENENS